MNILTFDTEEWYTERAYNNDDFKRYKILDCYLNSILDLLDEQKVKATFFCVGGLAKEFPHIVRQIADKGHEIGCHSNTHMWLNTFNNRELKQDTETAIKSLEDLTGKRVVSYRAPAFSIGDKNKWALEVLAECGIERDASVYPANRDIGGFAEFPAGEPCIIKINGVSLKEFPVSLTSVAGRKMAYSGGGYFRFFPLNFIKGTIKESDYVMTYFHINDLEYHPFKMMTKESYERYFKRPGTFKNRFSRMIKRSLGSNGAFEKMSNLIRSFDFVNLEMADDSINWSNVKVIEI